MYKAPFRKSSHIYRTSDDTSIGIKASFVVLIIITLLIVTFLALVVCVAYNFLLPKQGLNLVDLV